MIKKTASLPATLLFRNMKMKLFTLTFVAVSLFASPILAGRIHMSSPDYSELEAFEQYQYEQQLQDQLDAIAARQQEIENAIAARQRYLEELLQQNDDQ